MHPLDSIKRQAGPAGGRLAAGRLPRLLPAAFAAGPATLAEHLARYGPPPAVGRDLRRQEALIGEVARSGLSGRGGAGFPTATKLAAVAAGHAPVVVANGTEGEPASAKDKVLLARSPHLVLDGAVLAAEMVGAREAVIVVHHAVREIVDDAVAERKGAGSDRVRIRVVTAADRFVGGEASAVIHWIDRGIPVPTRTPPRISQRGLGGRPTLLQNVETLAHLALIGRYGAAWFRAVGTPQEPGSLLVTILGAVREPGVFEAATGTAVTDVLGLAGGASSPLQALLIGGYFGSWVSATAAARLPFSSAAWPAWVRASARAWSPRCPRTRAGWLKPPAWCAISPTSRLVSAGRAGLAWLAWPTRSSRSPRAARPISAPCGAGSARSQAGAPAAIPTAPSS